MLLFQDVSTTYFVSGLLDCILDSVYFYHDVGTKCHRVKHKIPYVLTYTPLCVEVNFQAYLKNSMYDLYFLNFQKLISNLKA